MTWQSLVTSSRAAAEQLLTQPTTARSKAASNSLRFRRWRQHCCSRDRRASAPPPPATAQCVLRQRWLAAPPPPCAAATVATTAAAAGPGGGAAGQPVQQDTVWDIIMKTVEQMQEAAAAAAQQSGAHLHVQGLSFQPPGAPDPLLTNVCMTLPPNQLGLVFGRSGAGKTTLLQLVAGLAQPNTGSVSFSGPASPGGGGGGMPLGSEARMAQAGLVFQFPERHFIGKSLSSELVVGWPLAPEAAAQRQALTLRTHGVLAAVGLQGLPLDTPLANLSDGYKRRVALAVQLVRRPRLLLLDEPLAGLDWRTRGELIQVLGALKKECTMLVVSHDLRELAPLVEAAWEMRPGGLLEPADVAALPMLL